MKTNKSLLLTESGIMLACATILSMIEIVRLPYGGSVTLFSMLPVILVAYRRGTLWGLFTAFAFSLLQMLLGLNNLSYGTSAGAVAAIILLDYVVAFTVLGLGGLFRFMKSQSAGLALGTLLVCVFRYLAHVVVGFTVWRDISIPAAQAVVYSFIYNATYMVPETLVTVIGGVIISRLIDFRGESLSRPRLRDKASRRDLLFSGISKIIAGAAVITDTALVFSKLQNPDNGEFDIKLISTVNWQLFAIVTLAGIILAGVFYLLSKRAQSRSDVK
ncbi:MAG TPA: hypothetical protein GXX54_05205 [Clostridiales bacterium]|nr:hypothetical protein [Clostridiales bacterium]